MGLKQETFPSKTAHLAIRQSLFRADGALDQFDVAITPLLQSFVEIGH